MIFLFLINDKIDRKKIIGLFEDKKEVFVKYPPSRYMSELLEVCKDVRHAKDRVQTHIKTYKDVHIDSPFSVRLNAIDMVRKGLKPYMTEKEKILRSVRMKGKWNPNFGGMTEEHKKKLSLAAIGKPGTNKGRTFSQQWRDRMSKAHTGNRRAKGLRWIYNPSTGEHRRIKPDEERPYGWLMGMRPHKY